MIRHWFQALFGWPCDHVWELLQMVPSKFIYVDGRTWSGMVWIYRCQKCCKSKTVRGKAE